MNNHQNGRAVTNFLTAYDWEKTYGEGYEAWRKSRWQGSKAQTITYLNHVIPLGRIEGKKFLYPHQAESLQRIVYSYEMTQLTPLLLNLATGTGKSLVMAAVMAWLACSQENINTFLLLCPNTIVRDRLKKDFEGLAVFKEFDLFPESFKDRYQTLKCSVIERFENFQNLFGHNVIVGNRHQFEAGYSGGHDHLTYVLKEAGNLAVFNDEAHNTRGDEYSRTLSILVSQTQFRLDVTATPNRADELRPESHEIYELSVLEAITGSYKDNPLMDRRFSSYPSLIKNVMVKRPSPIMYQAIEFNFIDDATGKKYKISEIPWDDLPRHKSLQLVLDPGPMKLQLQLAVEALELKKKIAAGRYKPLLFVIGPSIEGAKKILKMMKEEFHLNPLLVIDDETEYDKKELRKAAADLGDPKSPFDSVVSVYMLREGWDVAEVSVMCLLRGFGSPLFARQVLGRGLRIIRRNGLSTDESVQELTVIDHPALALDDLWAEIDALVYEGDDVIRERELNREPKEYKKEVIEEQGVERPELLQVLRVPDPKDVEHASTEMALEMLEDALSCMKDVAANVPNVMFVGVTSNKTETLRPGKKVAVKDDLREVKVIPANDSYSGGMQNTLQDSLMKWAEELSRRYHPLNTHAVTIYKDYLLKAVQNHFFNGEYIGSVQPQALYYANATLPQIKEAVFYEMNHKFYADSIMHDESSYTSKMSIGMNVRLATAVADSKKHRSEKSPYSYEKMDSGEGGELAFARSLDNNGDVIAWTKLHGIIIKYRNSKGKISRYLPDFLVRLKNTLVSTLIEIKGRHLMGDPNWVAKQRAAKDWCKMRGMEFEVVEAGKTLRRAA